MEIKNYPKTLHISPTLELRGVFIGTRGTGGQGTNPGPKRGARRGRTATETRLGPCFCGRTAAVVVASAALRAAPVLFFSCLYLVPVLCLQPLVLTESAS